MKKSKVFLTITIILALFSLAIVTLNKKIKKGIEVSTDVVKKGEIVSVYSTNGVVESKNKKEYFGFGSKIVKVYVKEGDKVKKGQKLIEFEVQDLSNQLKIAQNQYEIAKLQLQALKEQKERLSLDARLQQGQNLDNQIKIQEKQVEIARLNVLSIKDNISKQQRYITSDIDGVVTFLNAKEGAVAQGILITVEDVNNLNVALNINQYDVINLKKGQDVIIKFYDKEYKGVLDYISPVATKSQSIQGTDTVIKAYVKILDFGDLKPGFDVDVDIVKGKKQNVLKIPVEAIITDKHGNEYVYIVENNIAKKVKIKTGFSSDVESEVQGLHEGQKVVLNPPSTLYDGARVFEKEVRE
ncbi:HlyD family secretion protein [Caloramator fervidus]|uniref:HlyD family secretion protein n=1 Tax=Caloramator fervidus TaxID=29344 RepID=A0A1H5VJV1_9CLOT|nr:efflux RND transporter periplasmic adaptor subunit [Caloramator fervidus]SEF87121.1 HlyD family secretion protein [Caloramator fervidus]